MGECFFGADVYHAFYLSGYLGVFHLAEAGIGAQLPWFDSFLNVAGYTSRACGVVFIMPLHLDALTGFCLCWQQRVAVSVSS